MTFSDNFKNLFGKSGNKYETRLNKYEMSFQLFLTNNNLVLPSIEDNNRSSMSCECFKWYDSLFLFFLRNEMEMNEMNDFLYFIQSASSDFKQAVSSSGYDYIQQFPKGFPLTSNEICESKKVSYQLANSIFGIFFNLVDIELVLKCKNLSEIENLVSTKWCFLLNQTINIY